MKIVVQRVLSASVHVNNQRVAHIEQGMLLLVGIEPHDTQEVLHAMCKKLLNMRFFSDSNGKMNHNIKQVNGNVLLVSQFTLCASVAKGNRPSFTQAAPPDMARALFQDFAQCFMNEGLNRIQLGVFGADMKVSLQNDGPVTFILDSSQIVKC